VQGGKCMCLVDVWRGLQQGVISDAVDEWWDVFIASEGHFST